jgi:hypothetical protein
VKGEKDGSRAGIFAKSGKLEKLEKRKTAPLPRSRKA